MKLLVATHNRGKLREFEQIFEGMGLDLLSLDDVGITWDVAETGATFEANARLKAETYSAATGLATLADDSGLEVDALGGAPGMYSARYGGPALTSEQRYELLLENLRSVPHERRTARFYCVLALAVPGKPTLIVDGEISGLIASEPRGEGGFGYDPVFWLPEYGATMAELPAETKNRISHRARAAEKLSKRNALGEAGRG
jgi:XTP/dITP diphosphohydrolase